MSMGALNVFVGHRFTPGYMDDFRAAIDGALASMHGGLQTLYADMTLTNGHILKEKIQPMIDGSLFCLFDITEQDKPNVFIELGYAFGRNKHVVLTSRAEPPADLAGFDVIRYRSFKELSEKLRRYLPQIVGAALPTIANPIPKAELPGPVTELLYENWHAGKTTAKEEIYGHMDRESADFGLAAFVKAGMLFDAGAAVGLTTDGGKFFGQALGKQ